MDNLNNEAIGQQQAIPRPRITNACEACRSAKVKCQASNQLGICRRCFDSKRECIFKTGPRTRRPRQSKLNDTAPRPPPPPGPSKTFTIDIPMPDEGVNDVSEGIEALRLAHEVSIDDLVPYDSSDDAYQDEDMLSYDYNLYDLAAGQRTAGSVVSNTSSLPVGASALSTPPSSIGGGGARSASRSTVPSGTKKSLATIGIQPQFNVDSASALLETFRSVMLRHFPVILIPEDATVASLARERPFVLLAVLAASSSTRSLQGHSLYDEEFRKILGLKFVAGGERSLELLVGLVIYVAWYPFHLRPKNKQAFQYVRMTVDIINDLDLDQDQDWDHGSEGPSPERLEEVRAYLGSYYQVSNYGTTWNRTPSLNFTAFTSKCCDLLEQYSQCQGDKILAWQVRLQRIVEETNDMRRRNYSGTPQSESQIDLMIRGMEGQLVEWEKKLPEDIATVPSIRLGFIFARMFLFGAPLLKMPSNKPPTSDNAPYYRADPRRLASAIPSLRAAYDYYLSLPAVELNSFTGVHWSSFILIIILGFRMSFPLVACPGWDDKAARAQINYDGYIQRFCGNWGGDGPDSDEIKASLNANLATASNRTQSLDILSASKVVLGVVRNKFHKKMAKLEPPPPPRPVTMTAGGGAYNSNDPSPSSHQHFFGVQHQQQQHNLMPSSLLETSTPPPPSSRPDSTSSKRRSSITTINCPMLDGSMEAYFPYFDEAFTSQMPAGHPGATTAAARHQSSQSQNNMFPQQEQHPSPQAVPGGDGPTAAGEGLGGEGMLFNNNDLWATMTMNWASTGSGNDINFDGI